MPAAKRRNTTQQQRAKKRGGVTGKGFDVHPEHINRKGRPPIPKDVKELNEALDKIFAEEITDGSGQTMQKLYVALNRLLLGKNARGVIHLLERRYGKVPQPIIGGAEGDAPIQVKVIEVVKNYQDTEEQEDSE